MGLTLAMLTKSAFLGGANARHGFYHVSGPKGVFEESRPDGLEISTHNGRIP